MKWIAYSLTALALLIGCEQASMTLAENPSTQPTSRPAAIEEKLKPDAKGKVALSDAEWKQILSKEQYRILREKGTERPFKNKYDHHFDKGTYECAACGAELFASDQKYDSGCGWPAFSKPYATGKVDIQMDADGHREEVLCSRCGGHLGHVFDDGPPPTGKRFCINSESLKFVPAK